MTRSTRRLFLAVSLLLIHLPVWAQATASGVIFEIQLGPHGSASELIRAPGAGLPLRDPHWVYETLPTGNPNPGFASATGLPSTLPVLGPLPAIPDSGLHTLPFSLPGTVGPASLPGVSLGKVLPTGFTVLGWKHWQESAILVTSGQRFSIKATGRWSTHQDQNWCGPEGYGPPQTLPGRPGHPPLATSFSRPGELIGRIGAGPGFRVGAGGDFTADRDGALWFTINDTPDGATAPDAACVYCGVSGGHCANNRGQVTVSVSIPR